MLENVSSVASAEGMAWTFSEQVLNLSIQQHANGSTTYTDANGVQYLPIGTTNFASVSDVINTEIGWQEAVTFSVISLILVLFGGIASGLNVSLLSIDARKNKLMVELAARGSVAISETQRIMMDKIQPLIEDRHLLLVTLLVAGAVCMEALPIFLDELVASWLAVVISVTFVLVFGEILPQALFTSDPLKAGYRMYYVVIAMKWLLYPICRPLAYLLDIMFPHDENSKGVKFSQKEIAMIMDEISKHRDERTVVAGALKIAEYTVSDSIVPWDDVQCIDANIKLDSAGLRTIYKTGYSRIPIYEGRKENVIGILLVKTLVLCDPDPELTLKEFLTTRFKVLHTPQIVYPDTPLYDTINLFQEKKTHFAMVVEHQDSALVTECFEHGRPIPKHIQWAGIITLEDIMEDIIQEEIADEFDSESPLAAILERTSRHSQSNLMALSPSIKGWTADESFALSVNARFSAKNKRTLRAKRAKKLRHSTGGVNNLDIPPRLRDNFSEPMSDSEIPSPFSSAEHNKKYSKSDGLLNPQMQPLLSNADTSINMKIAPVDSAKTSPKS